jgi:hypothetical protein
MFRSTDHDIASHGTENDGNAPTSGPLSWAQAGFGTKYKLDFTKMAVGRRETGIEKGPTRETCSPGK